MPVSFFVASKTNIGGKGNKKYNQLSILIVFLNIVTIVTV